MKSVFKSMKALCWMVLLGTLCPCAAGQTVTISDVSRARENLARAKDLTDAERSEISKLYEQAVQSLQQETRWRAQQRSNARTKSVIEAELVAARAAAAVPLPGPPPAPPSETAQQVEEELTRVRNDRASHFKRRQELSKLLTSLNLRGDEIIVRRAEIQESLRSIQDEISVLTLASASPQWEQARRTELQARRQSLQQELQALGTEREVLDPRRQLIPLQREAYLLRMEAADQLLGDLRVREANARLQDAKKLLDDAVTQAQALAKGFPQLSTTAADITSRATALWGPGGIEVKSDQTATQSEQLNASLARFKEITASTLRRFENSGVFSPASDWWPPRVEKFGKPAEVGVLVLTYSAAETFVRRDVFKLEEERNAAPAFETELQQLLDVSGKKPDDADFADFKSRARSLLQLKRSVMGEFLATGRVYVNRLAEARRIAEELLAAIRDLESFALQHVLWSRSVTGPFLPSPSDSVSAFLWFFSYRSWSQILAGFNSAKTLALFGAGLLAIFALFLVRKRLGKRDGESWLSAWASGRMWPLFSSIFAALLSALPAPLAIAYVGWIVGRAGAEVELGRAIAAGAESAARFLYLALLTRRMLAKGGAADLLLGWKPEVRESLDQGIKRLTFVFTPLYFVSAAFAKEGMYFHSDSQLQSYHNSLGRLCFMAAVLSLLYIGHTVLKRHGIVANALGERFDAHGLVRARVARTILTLAFSMAFLLAFTGFYITAYLLVQNTVKTAVLTIVLMLVYFLIRRWKLDQGEKVSLSRSPQDEAQARAIDLQAREADLQVRRLSRFGATLVWIAGVFIIWSATLPALSLLRRVELLPEFRVATDRVPAPASQPAAEKRPAQQQESPPAKPVMLPVPAPDKDKPVQPAQPRKPLYLSGALLAIFVGILTSMLVSNIPGLLQFTVFRRFKLDVGGQYAVSTITRYLVIIAGVLIVSGILAVNWSNLQWLAAALTFGIGFGLQEIFANFASGLILLLDRSIRVGDAVTVGNLSGIVARIQMRATTVTLWDRSDMVVPNKEFITTKLVNWTLSHPETRVDLKVGVVLGSDVEQVRGLLLRLAHEHPAVLKTPPPQVLLTEFAGGAIMFELRVFCMFSYGRPVLQDELYRSVVRGLRDQGIEIAIPQLGVHLKALPKAPEPN